MLLKSRMDVVATMTLVAQEILLKQNKISANVVRQALGAATTADSVVLLQLIIGAGTDGRFD